MPSWSSVHTPPSPAAWKTQAAPCVTSGVESCTTARLVSDRITTADPGAGFEREGEEGRKGGGERDY